MKISRYNFSLALIVAAIGCSLPFLISGTTVPQEREHHPDAVYSPDVPAQAEFAGKAIELNRYDLRERMDRELTTFCYMHSTTMLMLKRANRYFPIVEPILKANGIPDDFKYLMVIESNLDTRARSPRGAAGLWQFMEATGKEFGLKVNKNVDERYHIEKATRAACRYFRKAYERYGDWLSVAASYNAGQRRISSSLEQQDADTALDLWLNEETSRYMFRILAAKAVFSRPSHYGFRLKRENLYPAFRYTDVTVNAPIPSLATFAKSQGISYAQLKDANVWLRDTLLENKSGKTYVLKIPARESVYYNPSHTHVHNPDWIK